MIVLAAHPQTPSLDLSREKHLYQCSSLPRTGGSPFPIYPHAGFQTMNFNSVFVFRSGTASPIPALAAGAHPAPGLYPQPLFLHEPRFTVLSGISLLFSSASPTDGPLYSGTVATMIKAAKAGDPRHSLHFVLVFSRRLGLAFLSLSPETAPSP